MPLDPARNEVALQLLDVMETVVALVDLDGTVLMANAAAAARSGMTREEMIGRCAYDLMPPDVAAFRRERLDEVARTGQATRFTVELDGCWQEHRMRPVLDDHGNVARVAVTIADVTEIRRIEQERLAKSVELEMIHAHVPVGILLLDADRRVTKANHAVSRMAGLSRENIVGRIGGAALDCLNHLDDERGCGHGPNCGKCDLRVALKYALEDDMVINGLPVTLPVPGPDGREFKHVLVSAAPVDIDGRRQVLVTLQDISRLREAEADVAFKAMVLDQIRDRVTVTNLQGKVIYVNNATCRSLQARREELVGNSVAAFGDDPTQGATQREILEKTLATGSWEGEVVNIARDGVPALLHYRTALVRDGRDLPVGMCGVSTDITEGRRREVQLRESERRFRRLHEQLPIGYFGLDSDGRYVEANPAWLKLLGLEREAIEGRMFTGQLAAGHLERFAAARGRVQTGREEQVEIEIATPEGKVVTVFCVGRGSLNDQGAVEVTHWVAADVSERRRLESQLRQAQKLDALGRLAAGVSHDFNNQLTVISGYCDILLAETDANNPHHAALMQIRRATERASSTTGHLLSFSRKRDLAPRCVDLNALVHDLLHPVGKMIGETIRVRPALSPRLQPVCVDPGALQQAIFNLIINARDAMPDGGNLVLRTANRRATTGAANVDAVEFSVEDNGHGIAPSDLERVFEPFFTTKTDGKGTGLGLSMVRGFVEQSGGGIELRSRPGTGTIITLVLPAALSVGTTAAPDEHPEAEARLRGRYLVVEDSDDVRELVVDVLRHRQAEVVAAASPEEALALAATGPPFDLLVTDVVMPGMRGDALAARLLAQGRVHHVVYMSGYHDGRNGIPEEQLLSKPFAVKDLVGIVQRTLSGPVPTVGSAEAGRWS
jgi:PAS domain S-box-containing protein